MGAGYDKLTRVIYPMLLPVVATILILNSLWMLPIIVLYGFSQRYVIGGLTEGALK